MNEELLKKNMERHGIGLSEYACLDEEAIRFHQDDDEEDFRTPFFRDIDRIIYTYAFLRMSDKTQVFSVHVNDHISRRMIHIQYVSKIARTIGRALGLNEDLIEAASLGHDLGHTPFGHFGEQCLSEISQSVGEGYFNHNVESVRLLMYLEHNGEGSNITVQVLDAILSHNGEFIKGEYAPVKKSKEEFLKQYSESYQDQNVLKNIHPMTLEGCVVRVSDVIAYLGRDIDDAYMMGIVSKEDVPDEVKKVLGTRNKEIVNTIIKDIINNSLGHNYIKISDEVHHAMNTLMQFNYQHIYAKAMSEEEQEKIKNMFQVIFHTLLNDIQNQNKKSFIYKNFLNYKKDIYYDNTSNERQVIDFIAGMTNHYFVSCYDECMKESK